MNIQKTILSALAFGVIATSASCQQRTIEFTHCYSDLSLTIHAQGSIVDPENYRETDLVIDVAIESEENPILTQDEIALIKRGRKIRKQIPVFDDNVCVVECGYFLPWTTYFRCH